MEAHLFVPPRIMRLLKLLFNQNSIMINHKLNNEFNVHIIFEETQKRFVAFILKLGSLTSFSEKSTYNFI
jgi:hypothetical protein